MLTVSAASLGIVVAVLVVTFFVGERLGRHNVVDVAWGVSFVGVALCSAVLGDGDSTRKWLLAALVSMWGLRLAIHLAIRSRGQGEDPRYEALLAKSKQSRLAAVITKVYLLQGVLIWFISLPIQLSATRGAPPDWKWLVFPGIGIWCVGLFFEGVGDAQLHAFKRDPANRGVIITTGLWRYTRHPNYFGDACVWWGLFLIACDHWIGLLTIIAPWRMTNALVNRTGKKLLEKKMRKTRPGYEEYIARTSGFFPWPPRKG